LLRVVRRVADGLVDLALDALPGSGFVLLVHAKAVRRRGDERCGCLVDALRQVGEHGSAAAVKGGAAGAHARSEGVDAAVALVQLAAVPVGVVEGPPPGARGWAAALAVAHAGDADAGV